ncbi:hypothetical protein MHI01_30930 [Paenibacillus sp. FSL M7-0656]|uniref:hypothetical protein n=1 Tax=Paenibacillus sp. FSL M7-0656 TaxID=2921534 RepID=UPI0030FA0782
MRYVSKVKKFWSATKSAGRHAWNFITSEKCTRLLKNLILIVQFIIILIAL